jgi:hypothetical protein
MTHSVSIRTADRPDWFEISAPEGVDFDMAQWLAAGHPVDTLTTVVIDVWEC